MLYKQQRCAIYGDGTIAERTIGDLFGSEVRILSWETEKVSSRLAVVNDDEVKKLIKNNPR